MNRDELKDLQQPLKERYRSDPDSAVITLRAEGELDFRGTLAVDREAPVGFRSIRLLFDLEHDLDDDQLATLMKLTERYCVVYQTLTGGVPVSVEVQSAP